MIVVAFPTMGKSSVVRNLNRIQDVNPRLSKDLQKLRNLGITAIDLDYGKYRDMFGFDFSSEKNRGANLISHTYVSVIKALIHDGIDLILTNEPHCDYTPFDDIYFLIPSYNREGFIQRVEDRGDNMNADWAKFIYSNFDRCVDDWRKLATSNHAHLVKVDYVSTFLRGFFK